MKVIKEDLTEEKVAEIIEARYKAEISKNYTEEDKKVIAERWKEIEEYGKKHCQD